MNIGMLWFDNSPTTSMTQKISKASQYYQEKYGKSPNLCFVHPSMDAAEGKYGEIEVRKTRAVLPNHFWIGVNGNVEVS